MIVDKPTLVAVNLQANRDYVYITRATFHVSNYMKRIGVQQWSITDWQSVIWYDGIVRVMPYQIVIDGKDKFVFNLAGGFRPCCDDLFSKLDEEGIRHNGIPI